MSKLQLRSQTALILPLVLLALVLCEELAVYRVRKAVADVHVRTAIVLAFYGVGFALATDVVAPRLKRLLKRVRTRSRRGGGAVGVWLFYALAYGAVYYAFLRLEIGGPAALLPAAWH